MHCIKCGNNLGENDVFCPKCGTPVQKPNGSSVNERNGGMYNYNYDNQINQQPRQTMNQQPNAQAYANKGGDNTTKVVRTCIVIVIIFAILAAVGFVVYNIFEALNGNKETGNVPNNVQSVSTVTSTSNVPSTPNENSNTVVSTSNTLSSSTYKVNYRDFELHIPDNLMYEMDIANDAIAISDSTMTWVTEMTIEQVPFEQLKQNKNYLSSYFTENLSAYNAVFTNTTVETIDGVEMILLDADISGAHMIMGVAGINSMYVACFEVLNEDNDYDKDIINNITPIIKTAKYNGTTRNIEMKGNIKMTDLIEALKKAAENKTAE